MRILQTPPRFYPYIGGVENYAYFLCRELFRSGHEVKVVCADEPRIGSGEIAGIDIKRLNYITKVANTNITLGLVRAILQEDFDLLHTHLPTPWSADLSAVICGLKHKPLVLTYHNNVIGNGINSCVASIYNATALKPLLNSAKKIIITHQRYLDYSPHLRNYCKKIAVIPVGVDLERFQSAPRDKKAEKTILFLGILDEYHRYKGLDYLIRALALLKKDIPGLKLVAVGEGSLKQEYKKLAVSLAVADQIEFAGFIPCERVAKYYHDCDAFVLPSISCEQEGFGTVLLEAMACARPVVTTHISGSSVEITRNGAGIVVEPKDVPGLAAAISEILKDGHCAQQMGANARLLVEKQYSWHKVCAQVLALYSEILG